jgi:2,4-dienoyl-CoA reductase (NADPH2)
VTEAEIDELVAGHAVSTANAIDAGFDGVELHAAHGYLVSQFLSGVTNVREAELERRVGFLRRLLVAMRAAAPGRLLGVRLSVGGEREAGLDLDGLCAVLPHVRGLVDYVNLTVGVRTTYVRDMGTAAPPLLADLPRLRTHVDVPLVACQAFRDQADMEAALGRGADLVGMARPLIADPDLPVKLLSGRASEIRPCVSCNEDCRAFDPCLLCSVNPDLAPPGEARRPALPLRIAKSAAGGRGRIAIVGTGPAGLECALRLGGQRAVTIFEAGERIGGQLAIAAAAPHRRGWARLLDFYASALERLGAEIRLGHTVTAADLDAYDEVVIAIGAEEARPEFPALRSSDAIAAGPEALAGAESLVVVDDGYGWWPCVSAVELGVTAGVRDITVLTPGTAFAAAIPAESRVQLLERLGAQRLTIVPLARADTVDADAVIVVGERRPRAFDWIGDRPGVRAAGDCIVPRRVQHAVSEGCQAAAEILQTAPLKSLQAAP